MKAKEGLFCFTRTHLVSILCTAVIVVRVESVEKTGSISTVYSVRASGRNSSVACIQLGFGRVSSFATEKRLPAPLHLGQTDRQPTPTLGKGDTGRHST